MARRAHSYDGKQPHPLISEVLEFLAKEQWIEKSAIRMRDQWQVFHVEVLERPKNEIVDLEQVGALRAAISKPDWKLHDVVVVATQELTENADTLDQISVNSSRA